MQNIDDWRKNLHAAFKKHRPRNVRFQMLTDYTGRKVGLWREGGNVPDKCRVEITLTEQWFGFEATTGDEVTPEQADALLLDLLAKFAVPHKKGK